MDTIYGLNILHLIQICVGSLYYISDPFTWEDASNYCITQFSGTIVQYESDLIEILESCHIQNQIIWLGKPWTEHIGCKVETLPLRIKSNIPENEVAECLDFCGVNSQVGVQRKACKCFATSALFGPTSGCSTVCPGNSAETCGGFRSMDTYRFVNIFADGKCQSLHFTSKDNYSLQSESCSEKNAFTCRDSSDSQTYVCDYQYRPSSMATTYLSHLTTESTSVQSTETTKSTKQSSSETVFETTTMSTRITLRPTKDFFSLQSTPLSNTTESELGRTTESVFPPASVQVASLEWWMFVLFGAIGTLLVSFIIYFCVIRRIRNSKFPKEEKTDFEIIDLSEIDKYAADIQSQEELRYKEGKEKSKIVTKISTEFKRFSQNLSFSRHDRFRQNHGHTLSMDFSNQDTKRGVKGRQHMPNIETKSVILSHRPVDNQRFENIRHMSHNYGTGHSIKALYEKAYTTGRNDNPRHLGRISSFKPYENNEQKDQTAKPIVTIRKK